MANPEHVKVALGGREAIQKWIESHHRLILDLSGANLSGAKLSGADLSGADLISVQCSKADFTDSHMLFTTLGNCNLVKAVGLAKVRHDGPCTIGVDTLTLSFRGSGNSFPPELKSFFLNAGVPKDLLGALQQTLAEVKYYTCFVCYGQPDIGFAETLVKDLKKRGVSCWLYSMDATPGERTWAEINKMMKKYEKMIILCSAQALVRDGVRKEIEEAIDEEQDKIIPISLDNLWKEKGFSIMRAERDLKPFLMERNYCDFTKSTKSAYEDSLNKLLKGLKR